MALTKAKITIKDKVSITSNGKPYQSFDVMFNPTEYSLNKSVQIAEIAIPGIDSPILQFIRGQNEKLTLDLFFDVRKIDQETTATNPDRNVKDVRLLTDRVYQLVKIHPDLHAPPKIQFVWGQGLAFTSIVESVQQKFEVFDPDGIPLRATLSVVFREYKSVKDQLGEIKKRSSDHTKQYKVEQGDNLSRIAEKVYDDPRQWRPIAEHNNIANPRRLTPGSILEIPPIDLFGGPFGRAGSNGT